MTTNNFTLRKSEELEFYRLSKPNLFFGTQPGECSSTCILFKNRNKENRELDEVIVKFLKNNKLLAKYLSPCFQEKDRKSGQGCLINIKSFCCKNCYPQIQKNKKVISFIFYNGDDYIKCWLKEKPIGSGSFKKCYEMNLLREGKFDTKCLSVFKQGEKNKQNAELSILKRVRRNKIASTIHMMSKVKCLSFKKTADDRYTIHALDAFISEIYKTNLNAYFTGKTLKNEERIYWAKEIFNAAQEEINNGIFHLDFKLANLMKTEHKKAVIIDLGNALILDKESTNTIDFSKKFPFLNTNCDPRSTPIISSPEMIVWSCVRNGKTFSSEEAKGKLKKILGSIEAIQDNNHEILEKIMIYQLTISLSSLLLFDNIDNTPPWYSQIKGSHQYAQLFLLDINSTDSKRKKTYKKILQKLANERGYSKQFAETLCRCLHPEIHQRLTFKELGKALEKEFPSQTTHN